MYLGRFVGYEIHGQKHRQVQQFPDLVAMKTKPNQWGRPLCMKCVDYLPNGFQSFVALASLSPQGDAEVVSTDGNHRATDFIVGILFANDRKHLLKKEREKERYITRFARHHGKRGTYHVQPEEIDRVAASSTRELNDEFPTVCIGRVFPFRTNALFEEVVVGIGIKLIYLGQIVEGAVKKKSESNGSPKKMQVYHAYPQKLSTVSTVTSSFKFSAQDCALVFNNGLSK